MSFRCKTGSNLELTQVNTEQTSAITSLLWCAGPRSFLKLLCYCGKQILLQSIIKPHEKAEAQLMQQSAGAVLVRQGQLSHWSCHNTVCLMLTWVHYKLWKPFSSPYTQCARMRSPLETSKCTEDSTHYSNGGLVSTSSAFITVVNALRFSQHVRL